MVIKDYYKILGFENSRVSLDEVKNAYREQAKKYHPDLYRNNKKAESRYLPKNKHGSEVDTCFFVERFWLNS